MRNVKPGAVAAGTAVSLALIASAYVVFFVVSEPHYIDGGFPWAWCLAVLGAHTLGGLVAGGLVRRSPGLNGALSALLCPILVISGYCIFGISYNLILHGPASLVPNNLNSLAEVREFVTDEEFVGAYMLAAILAIYTFVAMLTSLTAGSVAGRLRSSSPI